MAPINLPDGSKVSEVILPDGSTASKVIAPDGSTVFSGIPGSVVTRETDDSTGGPVSRGIGLGIEVNTDWLSIGAEISSNTGAVTRAYLVDSNDSLIADVDISGLSAGDAFTFNNVNLTSGNKYGIYVDAEGGGFEFGYFNGANYPYTSPDVDIVEAYDGGFAGSQQPRGVNNIGNTGF